MFGNNFHMPIMPRIISSLSKTLDVFKEVIPIYKEAQPLVKNARTTINKLKQIGNNAINNIMTKKEENITPIKEKINTSKSVNLNTPTFFK